MDYEFFLQCRLGDLDKLKELIEVLDIDVHEDEDYGFCEACKHGHFEVVKWLYGLGGVNIQTENNQPLKWACKNNHLEISRWIYEKLKEEDPRIGDKIFVTVLEKLKAQQLLSGYTYKMCKPLLVFLLKTWELSPILYEITDLVDNPPYITIYQNMNY